MTVANFPGLEDSSGEVFPSDPAGRYPCRITNVTTKVTKAKEADGDKPAKPSRPYWNFEAVVIEGEDLAEHKFFFMGSLPHESMTPEEMQRSTDQMRHYIDACGIPPDKSGDLDSSDFIGMECVIVNVPKTYQGKDRNNTSDVLPMSILED